MTTPDIKDVKLLAKLVAAKAKNESLQMKNFCDTVTKTNPDNQNLKFACEITTKNMDIEAEHARSFSEAFKKRSEIEKQEGKKEENTVSTKCDI
jgi:hypothetical protein